MNRTVAVVIAVIILCSGAVATAAAFTDGDEVAPDSEVYLDAADSENGEQYVQIDQNDEVRIRFDTLPPGSQTRIDDLFVVGFGGYEDSEAGTTVHLESTDERVALERMDTGETFNDGTIELQPGESVLFGAVVSTGGTGFSSTIELEVDVPDAGTGGGGSGGGGQAGGGGSQGGSGGGADTGSDDDSSSDGDSGGDGGGSGNDEPTNGDGDTPDGPTEDDEGGEEGADDPDDDTDTVSDATDPSVDPDADPESSLIELAGFGNPFSLISIGVIAMMLSLSYVYRVRIATNGFKPNTEKK
ncbi:hypothetical protein PM033_16695 [Halorubrum ezzemoulense]|jgi:hypothetical protein|uniref:hypothetical protein n=1 Tax=Halorubrum ezzemoulense TaxID=337243 RepID=UPI00232FC2FE|nr:hypothetical protein [Halorubrum ezzemoulense]MDB2253373.1 hypothetical protein [Halorubrum ezzemoulense]